MIEIDNTWPVWLIAAAVLLTLIPKAVQGLAILIPPLSVWLKSRESREEVLLHSQLDNEKFQISQDAQLITRLLNVVERTLEERAGSTKDTLLALERLEQAINNQARYIERSSQLFTVLNASLTGLVDRVTDLSGRVIHLTAMVSKDGKNRDD